MISVVVSTYENSQSITRCLESIAQQRVNFDVQVIQARSQNYPTRLAHAKTARHEVILFLDDDCVLPHPEYLQSVVSFMQTNYEIQLAGGQYLNSASSGYFDRAYNFMCFLWIISHSPVRSSGAFKVHNLLGGCLIIRKSIQDIVPFQDPQFWGGEDTHFVRRCQGAGLQCFYDTSLSVVHSDSGSVKKWIRRGLLHGYNGVKYKLRGGKATQYFECWPTLLRYLIPISIHQTLVGVGGLVACWNQKKIRVGLLINSKS